MKSQEFGGPWSVIKIELLKKYLHFYTQALKNQPFKLIYVDAFAGSGSFKIKQKETFPLSLFPEAKHKNKKSTFDGSAKVALSLDRPFDSYIFIEKEGETFSELQGLKKEFPDIERRVHLENSGANRYLQKLCDNLNWKENRAVLFLDPFGLQVEWDTIVSIANTKAIDLWFLFPIGSVNRMLAKNGKISKGWEQRINIVFGTNNWYDKFYKESGQLSIISNDKCIYKEVNIKSLEKYILQRLQAVFAGVAPNPRLLRTERNVPLFLLCFAIGNPKPKAKELALKAAQSILKK